MGRLHGRSIYKRGKSEKGSLFSGAAVGNEKRINKVIRRYMPLLHTILTVIYYYSPWENIIILSYGYMIIQRERGREGESVMNETAAASGSDLFVGLILCGDSRRWSTQ